MPARSYIYTERKNDIYILNFPDSGIGEASLSFPAKAKIVTGIQKLAQCFAVILLTATDSKLSGSFKGTELGNILEQGYAPQLDEVRHICNLALAEATEQIIEEQDLLISAGETISEDEQLVSAEMTNFSATKTSISLEVTLLTQAESTYTYVVPVSFAIT